MPKVWGLIDWPIETKKYFKLLEREYLERRSRNLEKPLAAGQILHIRERASFAFLSSESYNCESSGGHDSQSRSEPIRPRLMKNKKLVSSEAEFNFRLTSPLHFEEGCYAQVWRARSEEGVDVAVKIFLSCLGPEPEWHHPSGSTPGEVWEFEPEEETSQREAWAYLALRDLQGSRIPHSYGFYQVQLPSGDIACAHILEYIQGQSLKSYLSASGHPKYSLTECCSMMNYLAESVLNINLHGVIHRDFYPRNVICAGPQLSSYVVIDFGSAFSCSEPRTEEMEAYYDHDAINTRMLFWGIVGLERTYLWMEEKAAKYSDSPEWIRFLLMMKDCGKGEKWIPFTKEELEHAAHVDVTNARDKARIEAAAAAAAEEE